MVSGPLSRMEEPLNAKGKSGGGSKKESEEDRASLQQNDSGRKWMPISPPSYKLKVGSGNGKPPRKGVLRGKSS